MKHFFKQLTLVCLLLTAASTATAQDVYLSSDVNIINTLIANNALAAIPDDPASWEFAEWNNDTPKRIIKLDFYSYNSTMSGSANFSGLISLEYLDLDEKQLTALNVSNCQNLQTLYCRNNQLSQLNVSNCISLKELHCSSNRLSALDLTDLQILTDFYGDEQTASLPVFDGNAADGYSLTIVLNNPTFPEDPTLNYQDGTLTATGSTGFSALFTAETGFGSNEISGIMKFTYPDREQEYNPENVAIINDLINNNGLSATLDAPDAWSDFATWTSEKPKQITALNFSGEQFDLTGAISLSGLASLTSLDFDGNSLFYLDVNGLTGLETIFCQNNQLEELNASDCTNLESLYCAGNQLATLNVNGCENLLTLSCSDNKLTELYVGDCVNLESLSCDSNQLMLLDLTGLNCNDFSGGEQVRTIEFEGTETEGYTYNIQFNSATIFDQAAIEYNEGVLTSTDFSVKQSGFEAPVGLTDEGMILEGIITFIYPDKAYDADDVSVINELIKNNNLNARLDEPETWEFATWNNANPKQIVELDFWTSVHLEMSGEASLALPALTKLDCFQNNFTALDLSGCVNLEVLDCASNQLTALNLTGLDALTQSFVSQAVSFTLFGNDTNGYSHDVALNNPVFRDGSNNIQTAITYSNGTLRATDNTIDEANFEIETGLSGFPLTGTMAFSYLGYEDFFCGGDGSAATPYEICEPTQLNRVRELLDQNFILTNNLDLIDYIAVKYGSAGWLPIGDVNTPFTGNFNGNGCKITGLRNQATMDCISLFGNISGGTINNLDADCEGSSTGITQVELLDATPKAYYTILGRQLQKAPEKGVYIVLYDNGKAQKVVK